MARAQTTTAPDGRTLTFAEYGDLGGHPVISLHGTPGCRLLSATAVEHDLEGLLHSLGVRLIRYDRPGYGGAKRHPGRTVADSADDVEAVADAVGVIRFALEAGSGGAPHALAAAALLPDRVERVALVAPVAADGEQLDESALLHRLADADVARRQAAAEDPLQAAVFEATRSGLWGWVDDELAARAPWGFDLGEVRVRAHLHQGGEWLAERLRHAEVIAGEGDQRADWKSLYAWLAKG